MSIERVGIRISGPLAGFAEGYGTELTLLGYAPASVRLQLKVLADLSDWLSSHGTAPADLRRSDLDRFLRHRRAAGSTRYASIRAVRPVLDYLQRFEVVPRHDAVLDPVDVMLHQFWRYLTVERALAAVTARAYLDMVRPFVQGRFSADCRALNLERLTAADIISFVVSRCPRQSRGAAKLTVTALRSFLRFLHLDGVIEESLVSAVPSVAGRRLVGLPKGLAPDQVRRLLASCDDTARRGCRNIAILTLLVRLGMRSGEVAKLRLDDVDWRAGEIIVRGKANSTERIPLAPGRRPRRGPVSPAWPPGQRPGADSICQNQSSSSPPHFLRREQRGGRCRQAGRPRANLCAPAEAHGRHADVAGWGVVVGDRPTPASPPCFDDGDLRQGRPRHLANDRPPLARRRSMNVLRQALTDYLAVRRVLGYRLARAEKLLAQFLAFVEDRGEEHLTIETALAWATAPSGADPNWMSRRLSDVRRFAIHLRGIDPGYSGAADEYPARSITPSNAVPVLDGRDRHLDGGDHDLARIAQKGELSDIDRLAGGDRHAGGGGDRRQS